MQKIGNVQKEMKSVNQETETPGKCRKYKNTVIKMKNIFDRLITVLGIAEKEIKIYMSI